MTILAVTRDPFPVLITTAVLNPRSFYGWSIAHMGGIHRRGYLGYAGRKGYSLIEGRSFVPEKWF